MILRSYAINKDSDEELDALDSSTLGILEEVYPQKSNLSTSSLGVKGASVATYGASGSKMVNYSAGTTAYTTYMDS